MKPLSLDLRQRIIDVYTHESISQRQVAKRFQVSLSTVQRLVKRWDNGEGIAPKAHGGGHPPLLNPEQWGRVKELIEANNDATLEELQVLVEEHEDVWVSRSTMGRITQALGLTRKKTLHTSECQTDRVQTLRQEYWHTIGQVKLKDLIFLDEAGTHLGMTRRYARSEKGKRAYGQAPKTRGKNVTLIGALSWTQGFIAPMTWQGGTDGLTFRTYVEEVLVPTLWEGACVVMDNFKSHQVEGIRDAIEAVGATLIYLPPYSPDFSPIENCWSKIKESLRSQAARTYDALNDAMANAIDEIHQNDIIGWFTHCCYCGQDN